MFNLFFEFVESTKFRSTVLSQNSNNVEATFDFVERIVRLDIVAGVDGLQSLLKKVLSVAQYLCDG